MSLPTAAVSVPEDVTVGGDAAIASFSIADVDWISISSGDPNGHFYVSIDSPDTATLYVSSASPLNYENTSTFSLTLEGWNNSDPADTVSVAITISVNDVAEPGINVPPMAMDDDLWTTFHTPLSASSSDLLSNDYDPDNADLQVRIVSLPADAVVYTQLQQFRLPIGMRFAPGLEAGFYLPNKHGASKCAKGLSRSCGGLIWGTSG